MQPNAWAPCSISATAFSERSPPYVPGTIAGNYHFTSAIVVQLLKAIELQLQPLLNSTMPGTSPKAKAINQARL
jgi:hypothetical protein